MFGGSTFSMAGQQVLTPARNSQASPFKSSSNMKSLLQYGGNDSINNSAGRFKSKQPLSSSDFYYSQNPTTKEDYAKMLDAQIEQKKQYQNIQRDNMRNNRDLGKVNNINPHLIPDSLIAPNYGFQNGLQTQQSNFGFNQQTTNTGNYDTIFNPKNELKRTQNNDFTLDRQISQLSQGQNTFLRFTGQLSNQYVPLRLSQSQLNLQNTNQQFLSNQGLYNQPSLLNSVQMQQALQSGTVQKKTVNFNMPVNPIGSSLNQYSSTNALKQQPKEVEDKETFFEKWRDQSNSQLSKPQNFRGILKKENMSEQQMSDKDRKQKELNQALQEQILYKMKKKEIEERQKKLEDLVFAEKFRAELRSESNLRPNSSIDDKTYIKAVGAQQDRLQQRNIISRRLSTQNQNKQTFDDIKELPRTPPNQSQRNSIQSEGPMVRIEKIIDFSSNRVKAPSPRNRRSSQGIPYQDQILTEVKEAAEFDMDYIKDYYEFQKKVFNRQMASLQKEVSGVNDQRTQVFKDMLVLREKSKQEHLMNLMKPKDVLEENKYIMAQRKQNLYNFHQLEDAKSLYGGGNPYLQGIQYLPTNEYNFQNYYNDKQFTQLVSHSQLVPSQQLLKNKGKKNRGSLDNYDHSEQIIGEMRRKLELQDRINRQKPLSAGSKPKQVNKEDSFFRDIAKAKGFDKKSNKQKQDGKQQNSVENEFLEDEDAFEESVGAPINTEEVDKQKRPNSSKNFKEWSTDIEQFRREMFPGKKLIFEIKKEQQKEYLSSVEQYLWEVMSQNSEEYDQLDEQIDEFMGDIEKMVNKEAINNPPQVDDKRLSEIEMQRKMKAFLKGKELQEEHLQLLLREQAKEKLRQIERESKILDLQYSKENLSQDQNVQQNVHSYIKNSNSINNISENTSNDQKIPTVTVIHVRNENDQNETDTQNKQQLSQPNILLQEDQDNLTNLNADLEQEQKVNSRDSVLVQDQNKKSYEIVGSDIGKIQETDESGVSEKYDVKNIAQGEDQIKITEEFEERDGTINQQDQQSKQQINNKGVVDQNKLTNLYKQVIDNNSRKFDSNLFDRSLNNIDDMLTYFRDPSQKKRVIS